MAEQFFMMLTLLVFGGLIFAYFAAKVTPKKSVKAAAVETGTGKFNRSDFLIHRKTAKYQSYL